MKYDVLFNFISPVTGSIKLNNGYTIIGDENGFSTPSAVLKYLQNDFLKLKKDVDDLNYLEFGAINLGNKYDIQTPIKLGAATFPLPNSGILSLFSNIPIPNPTFDPLSASDWVMSGPWLPQILAGSIDSDLSNPITKVSSSLAMTQVRTAKTFKLFDHANFIVGSKNVSFLWDNPAYLLGNLDPKLAAVLALYDLGTTYNFTKAQSLGDLESGLLKNTVSNNSGTLAKAIPGTDYVELTNIPIGPLVVYNQDKFISPTEFKTRKNKPNEFGDPIGNTLNVLDGPLGVFTKIALTALTAGQLIKVGTDGELIGATKGTDYVAPDNIADILSKLSQMAMLIKAVIGVQETVDLLSITSTQAKNLNNVVKAIGGIKDTVDMVDVTKDSASILSKAVKNAVGVAETAEMVDLATKAASVATNAASLVEIEAQIAALASVTEINTLWNLFNSIGTLGTAIGGYHYGQYIRGQSLNVDNTWKSTDLNDECSNATGKLRALTLTPYSYENRGHGTLWFDSCHRDPNSFFSDTQNEAKSEAGLRIFSWDSTNDITDITNNPLSPIHIGLFGYRKYYTQADEYKGFIFNVDFDDDKGDSIIPGNITNDNYRFPLKFGLYDVKRKVSSITGGKKYGWESKEAIFEYDYTSFNIYKPVNMQGQQLHNIANGTAITDAVNLGQLNNAITNLSDVDNLTVNKELNIPVYAAGTAPINSFGSGAIWLEY